MVISLRHESCVPTILSVGVVVAELRHKETTDESELCGVHRLFIDDRLASLEEIIVILSKNVFIQWYSADSSHCMTYMETIGESQLLIILMRD